MKRGFLDDRRMNAAALVATFPRDHFATIESYGGEKDYSYEARSLVPMGADAAFCPETLSPAWRRLAADFVSPAYRAALSALTGTDLTDHPLEVNISHYGPHGHLGAHTDLPEKVVTSVDGVAMVSMIGAQRASFMFAAEEEATYLMEQAGVPANALKLVHFADVPPGERRYLLCSKATPDEVIERLNKVITAEFP